MDKLILILRLNHINPEIQYLKFACTYIFSDSVLKPCHIIHVQSDFFSKVAVCVCGYYYAESKCFEKAVIFPKNDKSQSFHHVIQFPPTSPKLLLGGLTVLYCSSMSACVNEWMNVCAWFPAMNLHPIQCVFLSLSQCYQNWLWNHCDNFFTQGDWKNILHRNMQTGIRVLLICSSSGTLFGLSLVVHVL